MLFCDNVKVIIKIKTTIMTQKLNIMIKRIKSVKWNI